MERMQACVTLESRWVTSREFACLQRVKSDLRSRVCTWKGAEGFYCWEIGDSAEASADLMPLALSDNKYLTLWLLRCLKVWLLLLSEQLYNSGCKMPDAMDDPKGADVVWQCLRFFFFWYTTFLFLMVNPLGWLPEVTHVKTSGISSFYLQGCSKVHKNSYPQFKLFASLTDRQNTCMCLF